MKKKSSFSNNILTLMMGTVITQAISILAAPIITRLYGPDAFGISAIFASLTGIIGVITCLRYELAIMVPKDDAEASNVFGACIIIAFIISIILVPVIWFGGDFIVGSLKAPDLALYLWMLPLSVLIAGLFLAFNYWNSRAVHFKRLAVAQVSSSVTSIGIQIGVGMNGYVSGGTLITANITGRAMSTTLLAYQILRDHYSFFRDNIRWCSIVASIKRYKNFPLLDSWSALLNSISWQLPTLLLAMFFSPTIVGFYALGYMLLHMPMNLIGNSISQVFFQEASEANHKGKLAILVETVFDVLIKIGIFPILVITILGAEIFIVIFGMNWMDAGTYAQILGIWVFIQFISSPLSSIFAILEKQAYGLKITSLNFITRLISLCIGGYLQNIYIALILFALSGIIVYGFLCMKILQLSGSSSAKINEIIITNLKIIIPLGIVLLAIKVINLNPMIILILAGIEGLIYYIFLIQTDQKIRDLVYQQLNLMSKNKKDHEF